MRVPVRIHASCEPYIPRMRQSDVFRIAGILGLEAELGRFSRLTAPTKGLAIFGLPGGRLIVMRNARKALLRKPLQRRLVGNRKTVDTDTQHQRNLVDQHIADRTQLIGITKALTQQRSMAEGAAIVESRKRYGNDLQAREIG